MKKVKLDKVGRFLTEHCKTESALEYKATAFELFGQIIENSPVTTGRARGNWNISSEEDESISSSNQEDGNYSIDDFPDIYIANGLDYIVDLTESPKRDTTGIINPAIYAARKDSKNNQRSTQVHIDKKKEEKKKPKYDSDDFEELYKK